MRYKLKPFTKLALQIPIAIGVAWWVNKKLKKEVTNVQQVTKVDIQNCIDKCTQNAQTIRNITNEVVDHRARLALSEADHQIEMCIHNCIDAKHLANS